MDLPLQVFTSAPMKFTPLETKKHIALQRFDLMESGLVFSETQSTGHVFAVTSLKAMMNSLSKRIWKHKLHDFPFYNALDAYLLLDFTCLFVCMFGNLLFASRLPIASRLRNGWILHDYLEILLNCSLRSKFFGCRVCKTQRLDIFIFFPTRLISLMWGTCRPIIIIGFTLDI